MSADRAASYKTSHRQPLALLAMHVGRICAARKRPVTAGEIKEMLACSSATAHRFLAAYRNAYPDIVEMQALEARVHRQDHVVDPLLLDAIERAWNAPPTAVDPAIEAARAAAARSDEFDNVDTDHPEPA